MKNAGLPRQAKSLVTASCHTSLRFDEVAANVRRSFGSRGGGVRQDVLITEDAVKSFERVEDQDACVAYEEAKEQRVGKKKKDSAPKRGGQSEGERAATEWF